MDLDCCEGDVDVDNSRVVLLTVSRRRLRRISNAECDGSLNVSGVEEITRACSYDQYYENDSRDAFCHRLLSVPGNSPLPINRKDSRNLIPSITGNNGTG